MSVNVVREIQTALKTGKVVLGFNRTRRALVNGKAKMVIVAMNAPSDIREEIEYYSKISGTPVYVFEGTSRDLGATCNKPFFVAAMAIIDPGESMILELAKAKGER
jgi:large subunit ribosomal protein L30e